MWHTKHNQGFSFLELMLVIAVIAIIATIALPSKIGAVTQQRVIESIELLEPYKSEIEAYFRSNSGKFPEDNKAAGLPEPNKLIGTYINKTQIRDGVLHIYLGRKLSRKLHNKIISIRPAFVKDSPDSPISWFCGNSKIPLGLSGAGRNLTNLEPVFLPGRCR